MKTRVVLLWLASVFVLSVVMGGCTPLDPKTAAKIPGVYDVKFEPLVVEIGGVAAVHEGNGVFKAGGGGTILNFAETGCLVGGKAPDKTVCMCEQFKICPLVIDGAAADVKLPDKDKPANNKLVIDVSYPDKREMAHIEGFIDGKELKFAAGIRLVLKGAKIGNVDCLSAEYSDVTGQAGTTAMGEFDGSFSGEVKAVWAAGCKWGPVAVGASIKLSRKYTAKQINPEGT